MPTTSTRRWRSFRASGVRVVAEPADQAWGERLASVTDPDGYVVHVGAPIAPQ